MKETYIQLLDGSKKRPLSHWGLFLKTADIFSLGRFKEEITMNYGNRHGIEVENSNNSKLEPYDLNLEFVYKGKLNTFHKELTKLRNYVSQKEFILYDEFSEWGVICRTTTYSQKYKHKRHKDLYVISQGFEVTKPATDTIIINNLYNRKVNTNMVIYWSDGSFDKVNKGDFVYKNTSVELYGICIYEDIIENIWGEYAQG